MNSGMGARIGHGRTLVLITMQMQTGCKLNDGRMQYTIKLDAFALYSKDCQHLHCSRLASHQRQCD
ncbi:hypothetical protein Mapa_012470 [Marchantia paleacea]|nr:hypothetical protein Mapa_012470 [Marchantia paleacea]